MNMECIHCMSTSAMVEFKEANMIAIKIRKNLTALNAYLLTKKKRQNCCSLYEIVQQIKTHRAELTDLEYKEFTEKCLAIATNKRYDPGTFRIIEIQNIENEINRLQEELNDI